MAETRIDPRVPPVEWERVVRRFIAVKGESDLREIARALPLRAASRLDWTAGRVKVISSPMIETTTRHSISVKPDRLRDR